MDRRKLFNFFRKGDLFIPKDPAEVELIADTEPVKGRSMVGHSRRFFLGTIAAAVSIALSDSIIPEKQREIFLRVTPVVSGNVRLREFDIEAYRIARSRGIVLDTTLTPSTRTALAQLGSMAAVDKGIFPVFSVIPHVRRDYIFNSMPRLRRSSWAHLDPSRLPE